jgi:hypothetical protein
MQTLPTPPAPRPLIAGDKLELENDWHPDKAVYTIAKSDAKFAYLANGKKISQAPFDAANNIYEEYWTKAKKSENRWSFPCRYRLLTPQYLAEKAAALAEKVAKIRAKLDEGIGEKQAAEILKILYPK